MMLAGFRALLGKSVPNDAHEAGWLLRLFDKQFPADALKMH